MKVSVDYLHHQGNDWLRELEFYKQELAILTSRLQEIAKRNTNKNVLAEVEKYQDRFILLREQIDTLHHNIGKRETNLEQQAKMSPEHITEKQNEPADSLLSQMKDFSTSIADTRFEFNRFLQRTM